MSIGRSQPNRLLISRFELIFESSILPKNILLKNLQAIFGHFIVYLQIIENFTCANYIHVLFFHGEEAFQFSMCFEFPLNSSVGRETSMHKHGNVWIFNESARFKELLNTTGCENRNHSDRSHPFLLFAPLLFVLLFFFSTAKDWLCVANFTFIQRFSFHFVR